MKAAFPIILNGESDDVNGAWGDAVASFTRNPGTFSIAISYREVEVEVLDILSRKIPEFDTLSQEVKDSIINQLATTVIRLISHSEKDNKHD